MIGILKKVINFYRYIENNKSVEMLPNSSLGNLEEIGNLSLVELKDRFEWGIEDINDVLNIELSDDYIPYLGLIFNKIDWKVHGLKHEFDYVYGGYDVTKLSAALAEPTDDFWKATNQMMKYTPDIEELKALNTLAPFIIQEANHAEYGCFIHEKGVFPHKICFYDELARYPMNLTLDEYFDAMFDSCAIALWQYFYIDPEEIIENSKGYTTERWNNIINMDLPKNTPRIEGILKHMTNISEILPMLFPDKDFSYHQDRVEQLKAKL